MNLINLIKTSFSATILSISSSALNFLLGLYLARSFTSEVFASYNYSVSLIAVFSILATLGLPSYILIERVCFDSKDKLVEVMKIFRVSFIVTLVVFLTYLKFFTFIMSDVEIILMAFVLFFSSSLMIRQALLVVSGDIILSNTIDKTLRIVLLILIFFISLHFNCVSVATSLLISYVLVEYTYYVFFKKRMPILLGESDRGAFNKTTVKQTSNLFVVALLVSLVTNVDILYLGHLSESEDLALIAASQKIALVGNLFLITLTSITTPILSSMNKNADGNVSKYNFLVANVGFLSISFFSLVVSYFRFELLSLFGEHFISAEEILQVYLIIICSSAFFGQSLTMMKIKKQYLAIFIILTITLILKLITMNFFYEYFGAIGVSYSSLLAVLIWNILMSIFLMVKFEINTTIIRKTW